MNQRIGDTVHYVSYGTPGGEFPSVCRAATVTEIGGDRRLGLCVVNPTGLFFRPFADGGCDYDPAIGRTPRGGTWHGMDECNPDGSAMARLWSGDSSGIGPFRDHGTQTMATQMASGYEPPSMSLSPAAPIARTGDSSGIGPISTTAREREAP